MLRYKSKVPGRRSLNYINICAYSKGKPNSLLWGNKVVQASGRQLGRLVQRSSGRVYIAKYEDDLTEFDPHELLTMSDRHARDGVVWVGFT